MSKHLCLGISLLFSFNFSLLSQLQIVNGSTNTSISSPDSFLLNGTFPQHPQSDSTVCKSLKILVDEFGEKEIWLRDP